MPGNRHDVSSGDLLAFTIVAHNYIPRAQIVADSFIAHHPDATFRIVVTDYPLQVRLRQAEDPRLVPITEIDFGAEGFDLMATFYDVMEFATAVKPFALKHFLGFASCVLYLDPDIEVYASLDPLVAQTRRAGISFTPHCLKPIERDGCQPSEAGIMMAGVYNLGYVGVARGAEEFLAWWSSRLRRDAISDPANHIFTDQRWIDLCIPLFQPHIETSPAYNVAYWNLDQRPIRRDERGYWIDDEPLRFFHFSGYDPNQPYWISKHQPSSPRVTLSRYPVLAELFNDYGKKLLGHTSAKSPLPYGWSQAIPGLTMSKEIRRNFREEVVRADAGLGEMPPSPFRVGGPQKFIDWLSRPAPGSALPLPRYLAAIWAVRPDLQRQMPEVGDGDLRKLCHWVQHSGSSEYEMLAILGCPNETPNSNLPWGGTGATEHGVNLVGYLNAELGVGQSARLTDGALRAGGVGVATVTTEGTISRQSIAYPADNIARYDTVLMGVNADQIGLVQVELGPSFMADRYTIAQWYWELERFPPEYFPAFQFVDEVWAASRFIADSIGKVAPPDVAVTHMPIPLTTPVFDPTQTREKLGLPDGFMFLFCWDMLSVLERKNPGGIVAAYCEAFGPNDGALLVLKTMNGRADLQKLERLRWECRDRPDIIVIDEVFDQVRTASLSNVCDCYVSLHRSEGLGLTMAEAMLLEKPVIATNYSGNVDFMDANTAHLVRWQPTAVGKQAGGYFPKAIWAEPDVNHAAELMRTVFNDPEAARQLGIAARSRILETHSLERCGASMRKRLEEIWNT